MKPVPVPDRIAMCAAPHDERLVFLREELLAELAGAGERGVEAA